MGRGGGKGDRAKAGVERGVRSLLLLVKYGGKAEEKARVDRGRRESDGGREAANR